MTLSLCFNWIEQTPNCSMFELLYILKITEFMLVVQYDSIEAFMNIPWIFWMALYLPAALESCFVDFSVYLWPVLDPNIMNNTDLMLLRLIYFTLTASKLWSWSSGTCGVVSHFWCTPFSIVGYSSNGTSMKTCILPRSGCPCWFLHTSFHTRHCLGGCCVPQYLYLSSSGAQHTHLCEVCQMVSKSLAFLILFSMILCALCTSTLHAQLSTHSLLASSMFSMVLLISLQSCHVI